ncbi:MAG: FAD-dependent oxidoreductase, partial [Lachnospiraceae bacterium]|nr:FAD-dependent oxidoreductase [Lachnospiraceae bacterium]
DIRYVGVNDSELRVFRNLSYAGNGLTFSSYLVQAQEECLLIGTVPDAYVSQWMEQIRQSVSFDRISHLIVFTEENSREAVLRILQENAEMEVIAAYPVLEQLKKILPEGTKSLEIRNNRTLTLLGSLFQFQMLGEGTLCPALYVLDQEDHSIYTSDLFGSLYCGLELPEADSIRSTQWELGMKDFFEDLTASGRAADAGLAAAFVREHEVTAIYPSIGPAVNGGRLEEMLAYYLQQSRSPEGEPGTALYHTGENMPKLQLAVSEAESKKDGIVSAPDTAGISGGQAEASDEKTVSMISAHPNVVIIYEGTNELSDYAACVENGLKEAEVSNVIRCNLSTTDRNEAIRLALSADVLLLGTTISKGTPAKAIWDVVTSLKAESCKGKLASIFYKVSTQDDQADFLREHLAFLGFDLGIQSSFFVGELTENDLKNAGNYGFGVGCSARKVPNPRKPKLVKCLVCGEIFDASLGTCPVCGVGLDQCVPVEEEEISYQKDTDLRYVILGGGVAGASAAEAIRKRDQTGEILILSAEDYLPIHRPMLTKNLSIADAPDEELYLHPAGWYEERRISLLLGETADAFDPERKIVHAAKSGDEIPYDRLIFATGAECFIPPFEGWQKEGVVTIRHLWDSRKIQDWMKNAKNAVVIGGGVLGLEAASELLKNGIHVTVLEAAPQIIGRQADADSAAVLRKKMAALGVECLEGVQIEGITGEERATGVKLKTGETFQADFVIVSCGNRANVKAAQDAGIQVERAIVVNAFMETNIPSVYACGDCAQYDGVNFQLWAEASEQGRIAGTNAAGERLAYESQLLGLNLDGFGTTLFAIGDPGKQSGVPYRLVKTDDDVDNSQEQYWFMGNALQGAVLIGRSDKTADVTKAVMEHARHEELF